MFFLITLATVRDAVTYVALLSLMATGITLLYKTTKVANFAHASFVTIGAYITYSLFSISGLSPYIGMLVAFPVTGLISLVGFYTVLEPLRRRGASFVILMIATLGIDIILLGAVNVFADYLQTVYKFPSRNFHIGGSDIWILGLPGVFVVSLALNFIIIATLYLLLSRTKMGIKLRASMENQNLSEVIGINTSFTLALSWFIAGALAGLSGALLPLWTLVNPTTGMLLIAAMFCASILGGLEAIHGAFLGSLIMGFAEILGISSLADVVGTWILPYRPAVPLLILAITLLILPGGITSIRIVKLKSVFMGIKYKSLKGVVK
ncbi:MAG: branched-chain amino acid ABC transporter permease [Candidatus Bathyarchaeia archaeon]